MDLAVAVLALVVALAAFGLALRLNRSLHRLPAEVGALRGELDQTRDELARAERELADLKAAAEVLPVPPLPRTRSARLDDLRQQLREAHREPGEATEG